MKNNRTIKLRKRKVQIYAIMQERKRKNIYPWIHKQEKRIEKMRVWVHNRVISVLKVD